MKKITAFLSFLSWIALLTYLGIALYQDGFDFATTLQSLQDMYLGGVLYLLDFSSIDLNYILYAFAVLLYSISLVLAFFKLLLSGRIFFSLSVLIHLSVTLVILLATLDNTSLLTVMFENVQSTSLSTQVGAIALLTFLCFSILTFFMVLLTFIRQPVKATRTASVQVDETDYLADELKRFVVPNQVSVQVPPIINTAPTELPPPVPMLQPQPIVQTPPIDANRRIDELKARETVQHIKEKIRLIIRAQLAQLPPPNDASVKASAPSSESSVVSEDMVRQLVTDLFHQEFQRLIQQQKEELSSLVNEELIKYDALNREVIETMINEKIEQQTVQALHHVEENAQQSQSQNVQRDVNYVTKDELSSALASLQPGQNQEDVIRSIVLSILAKDAKVDQTSGVESKPLTNSNMKQIEEPSKDAEPVTSEPQEELTPALNETPRDLEQPSGLSKENENQVMEEPEKMEVPPIVSNEPSTASKPKVTKSKSSKKKASVESTQPEVIDTKAPEIIIKLEDQFKSVLPPNSKVTRTGKKKIVRIPFQKRMSNASLEQKNHYDELKNYILSYRVKSRVSSVGDMFRLHKEEYVKIAIAGKGLKLYLALDPKDYENSTIPVDDASDKKMYQNIPLVFRVKSELSVKRAKVLIDDLMAKKNLPQKEVLDLPWSKQFSK